MKRIIKRIRRIKKEWLFFWGYLVGVLAMIFHQNDLYVLYGLMLATYVVMFVIIGTGEIKEKK